MHSILCLAFIKYFVFWLKSCKVVDGALKLRLASSFDTEVLENMLSATLNLI